MKKRLIVLMFLTLLTTYSCKIKEKTISILGEEVPVNSIPESRTKYKESEDEITMKLFGREFKGKKKEIVEVKKKYSEDYKKLKIKIKPDEIKMIKDIEYDSKNNIFYVLAKNGNMYKLNENFEIISKFSDNNIKTANFIDPYKNGYIISSSKGRFIIYYDENNKIVLENKHTQVSISDTKIKGDSLYYLGLDFPKKNSESLIGSICKLDLKNNTQVSFASFFSGVFYYSEKDDELFFFDTFRYRLVRNKETGETELQGQGAKNSLYKINGTEMLEVKEYTGNLTLDSFVINDDGTAFVRAIIINDVIKFDENGDYLHNTSNMPFKSVSETARGKLLKFKDKILLLETKFNQRDKKNTLYQLEYSKNSNKRTEEQKKEMSKSPNLEQTNNEPYDNFTELGYEELSKKIRRNETFIVYLGNKT